MGFSQKAGTNVKAIEGCRLDTLSFHLDTNRTILDNKKTRPICDGPVGFYTISGKNNPIL